MRDDDLATFDDAEVVSLNDGRLLCRVSGREVWVPLAELGIGDGAIHKPGQRGKLIIRVRVAAALGLVLAAP